MAKIGGMKIRQSHKFNVCLVFGLIVGTGSLPCMAQSNFVHPGLLHSKEDLERMRAAVEQGVEPITDAFRQFAEQEFSRPAIPSGAKTLTLKSENQDRRKGGGFVLTKGDCLFWGGGHLQLSDGRSMPFSRLQKSGRLRLNGIRTCVDGSDEPIRPGQDYGAGPVVIAGRPYSESLPAQPKGDGEVTIDLSGLDATRLQVDFGADYPQGNVAKYQRYTYSARTTRKTAFPDGHRAICKRFRFCD